MAAGSLRVLHVGNLCNCAYNACVFLRRMGVEAHLLLRPDEWQPSHEEGHTIDNDWITLIHPPFLSAENGILAKCARQLWTTRHIGLFRKFDVIHSWTGALADLMGAQATCALAGRPWIATATGADLRELAGANSFAGRRIRKHFRRSAFVTTAPDEGHFRMARQLQLPRVVEHRLPMDAERYRPAELPPLMPSESPTFLLASRLDWKVADPGEHRDGKGTDRFFRAFSRWKRDGGAGRLIVVRDGIDVLAADRLAAELDLTGHITWLDRQDKPGLIALYNRCDVVVDQFDLGSFGWVSLEAMACGRPVMVYLWEQGMHRVYGERPPVFNCRTEDEIYTQLGRLTSASTRERAGRESREFILRHHDWHAATQQFIDLYERASVNTSRGEAVHCT